MSYVHGRGSGYRFAQYNPRIVQISIHPALLLQKGVLFPFHVSDVYDVYVGVLCCVVDLEPCLLVAQ